MTLPTRVKRALTPAAALLLALGLAACGNTVSTSGFKGPQKAVAQALADLQSHATGAEQGKICGQDLAKPVVQRLGGKQGCEKAIKRQLTQTDNLELSVRSVTIGASGKTATATVKSTYAGKKAKSTVSLVNENGDWRVSGL